MEEFNSAAELTHIELIKRGDIRVISAKRKRKLQKRDDVIIWYSAELNSWVWADISPHRR